MSTSPPPTPGTTWAHAGVLVASGMGITLLIALVSARVPRVALFIVTPVVVASLAGAACGAAWCLRRSATANWAPIGAATLGGLVGAMGGVFGSAWVRGVTLDGVLASPLFERGLPGGAVLGTIVGMALLLLARMHQRELGVALQVNALEAARLRLENDRVLGELKVLQAQIEPHFLYNTLANLRYLIRTDPAAAATMLEHLIRYFKGTVPQLRGQGSTLGAELDLCEAYIDLMRMRTGGALGFEVNVAPALESAAVPPGMLLTLVENAIKHGAPLAPASPAIGIETARVAQRLVLRIIDNGPGPRQGPRQGPTGSGGVGLANIRQRLSLLFGDAARFELIALPGSGCEARLELPYSDTLELLPEGGHPAAKSAIT